MALSVSSQNPNEKTHLDRLADELRAAIEGRSVAKPRPPFDVTRDALYGGISGVALPVERFEVVAGLSIKKTYVRLIAPYILAFSKPHVPRAPHPGPWSALAETGLDIEVELSLASDARPFGFDRLNTLWFTLALLRLRLGCALQMPVLSDRELGSIQRDPETAHRIPVELDLTRRGVSGHQQASIEDLVWVKDNIERADSLARDQSFNRSLQVYNEALHSNSAAAAIVIVWASIETLLRPGRSNIADRVCRALAAHLYPAGAERDRAFGVIRESYRCRGGIAHSGSKAEQRELTVALALARSALMKTVEIGVLPDIDVLLKRWKERT